MVCRRHRLKEYYKKIKLPQKYLLKSAIYDFNGFVQYVGFSTSGAILLLYQCDKKREK